MQKQKRKQLEVIKAVGAVQASHKSIGNLQHNLHNSKWDRQVRRVRDKTHQKARPHAMPPLRSQTITTQTLAHLLLSQESRRRNRRQRLIKVAQASWVSKSHSTTHNQLRATIATAHQRKSLSRVCLKRRSSRSLSGINLRLSSRLRRLTW